MVAEDGVHCDGGEDVVYLVKVEAEGVGDCLSAKD